MHLSTRLLPRFLLLIGTTALAFLILLQSVSLHAQSPANATPFRPAPRVTPTPAPVDAWRVRVDFANQAAIDRLAARYDVWEVHHATPPAVGGWALIQVDAAAEARLQLEGHAPRRIEPAQAADGTGLACGGGATIADFPCYRTLTETMTDLARLAIDFPALAKWVDIGDSWEKTTPGDGAGNELQVLVVTNQQSLHPKFRFFVMGALHARELATAETAARFAELLVHGYGVDPEITWLLDHGEAHILAQANPDGRLRAEQGYCWRKNTNNLSNNVYCPVGGSIGPGVDLNRNFAFQWNGCIDGSCSSDYACSQVFRGVAAASEPEVDAIQTYLATIFPDVRGDTLADAAPLDTSGLLISLHSYGELVLYPWGWTNQRSPNASQMQMFADKVGFYTGYRACAAGGNGCLYKTDGTTDDWLYGELGIPGFTIEMGTQFFQQCTTYETQMVDDLLATLIYAFKAARQPYLTPAGPEPVNVALSADVVRQGDPLTLTATLDTTRHKDNNGRPIGDLVTPTVVLSATWYLDAPSWVTGSVGIAMAAVDGIFDEEVESVDVAIDTSSLSVGCHLLLVEGRDNNGQNGVPTAVGLEVKPSVPIAPTPQPSPNDGACWNSETPTQLRFMPVIAGE